MGNADIGRVEEVKQPTTGTGNNTSTGSTSTTTAGSGTGRGTGTGTGTETKEKEPVRLVTVNDGLTEEEKKRIERNEKRRERYHAQKSEGGQVSKPRKVNKAKKNEPVSPVSKEQFVNLLVSTSAVVASRPNCQHWLLTEAEAESIVKPLMAIIAESEKLELITKNSNQIALVIACITVIAPRLFITIQQNKTTPRKEKKPHGKVATQTTNNQEVNRADAKDTTSNGTNNDYVLSWDD